MRALALTAMASLASGCGDAAASLPAPLRRVFGKKHVDDAWIADSVFLASRPQILFRVVELPGEGPRIVPIYAKDRAGSTKLALTSKGWRALDSMYMHAGSIGTFYKNGQPSTRGGIQRGMWDAKLPVLDTIQGCRFPLPSARLLETGVAAGGESIPAFFAVPDLGKQRYAHAAITPAVRDAISNIPLLVGPTSGVPRAKLLKYKPTIDVISTGVSKSPTIVAVYDDPTPIPTKPDWINVVPRQLIAILDRGSLGYTPDYTYTTLGLPGTPATLRYLDNLDIDGDGVSEIIFGMQRSDRPLYLVVLKHYESGWRELYRRGNSRCAV